MYSAAVVAKVVSKPRSWSAFRSFAGTRIFGVSETSRVLRIEEESRRFFPDDRGAVSAPEGASTRTVHVRFVGLLKRISFDSRKRTDMEVEVFWDGAPRVPQPPPP